MKTLASILVLAVLLLECAACTSQPVTPTMSPPATPAITQPAITTITFEGDRCEYSGPDKIQPDQFTFQWVMDGQQYSGNAIYAIQMEDGHAVDELIGFVVGAPIPPWMSSLRDETSMQPGPWTKEVTWDLTLSGRFKPRPVYFLCSHVINGEEVIYGVAGPVEVEN